MRKEISNDTLGIPVIAIGIPTVVGSSIIVYDTINYLFKHISYIKDNSSKNKLVFNRYNYLDKIKDKNLSIEEIYKTTFRYLNLLHSILFLFVFSY